MFTPTQNPNAVRNKNKALCGSEVAHVLKSCCSPPGSEALIQNCFLHLAEQKLGLRKVAG